MILGVMQPYFFPYIGYFESIYRSDQWVVFDSAQYIRHGWVNRNRILHPTSGWQYIVVPVQRHHQSTPISEIYVQDGDSWRDKMLGQLQHYKKRAPFFDDVEAIVANCLRRRESALSRLNTIGLELVCAYLGIHFRYSVFSEMELSLGPVEGPGDWALRIAEALGANEYVNPPGGAHLFDPAVFEAAGIRLTIQTPVEFAYSCNGYGFQPNLSILDVMMWNSPEEIRAYLGLRGSGLASAVGAASSATRAPTDYAGGDVGDQ